MESKVPTKLFEHIGAMRVILTTKMLKPSEKVKQATSKLEEMYELLNIEFKRVP